MATENKDVIRVTDTEANLLSNLRNGMIGFSTDTLNICFKYGGILYKVSPATGLTNTYIPYNNSGVLDDSIIVNTALGIEVQGTCKINTVSHSIVDTDAFLVDGAVGTVSYRTGAELLSDLSGDAGADFDWNTYSLTNILNITASNKIECADLDITSISTGNIPYNLSNALVDSPVWIEDGIPTVLDTGVSLDATATTNGGLIIKSATGGRTETIGASLEFSIPSTTSGLSFYSQGRIITVADNTSDNSARGKMILGTRRYYDKVGAGNGWYFGDDIIIDSGGNVEIAGALSISDDVDINDNNLLNVGTIEFNNASAYILRLEDDTNTGIYFDVSANTWQWRLDGVTVAVIDLDTGNFQCDGTGTISDTLILGTCINAGVDTDKNLVLDATGNVDFRTNAELIADLSGECAGSFSFNNKEVSGISTLTTSNFFLSNLTTGYVPFSNNDNQLVASSLFCSEYPEYFIGINTIVPGAFLHIYEGAGGGATTGAEDHLIVESSLSTAYINIITGTAATSGLVFSDSLYGAGRITYQHASDLMQFSTNGLERFGLDSSGARIQSDSLILSFGAGDDMTIGYDGTDGLIDTSIVAASDLKITCGANKTIELQNSVYNDIQFPVDTGKVPATNAPTWEALTTNVNAYSFDVDDYIDLQCNEPIHGWVVGTDGEMHLHLSPVSSNGSGADRFAKFQLYISMVDNSGTDTWTETTQSAELTIPNGTAAVAGMYLSFGTNLDLSSYGVGSQIKVRVVRIDATGGTEYANNVFITQCGCHIQTNKIGSRTQS